MMMSLQQAAVATKGKCLGESVVFDAVSIDTRTLVLGSLYVAIRGEQFDGHDFIKQAEQEGACCIMVESAQETDLPQLIVEDCRLALGLLARAWREQLGLSVVGITGSNGKTTVKEMLASILAQVGSVFATKGNLNNDYGVPLTLLSLRKEHQFAVVEMGANHPNEIEYLTALTKPNVALINNAGSAHLEGFGSEQGVASAKGEIYSGLTHDGVAVINRDDQYADFWTTLCNEKKILSFAINNSADVRGAWKSHSQGSQMVVDTPAGSIDCYLSLPGEHNARNALAATASAFALGVELSQIKAGLEAVQSVNGRLKCHSTTSGAYVIDDSYNANPSSFSAAIEVLANCTGRKVLVMADMAELGDESKILHFSVGKQAAEAGVDALYALGTYSRAAVDALDRKSVV